MPISRQYVIKIKATFRSFKFGEKNENSNPHLKLIYYLIFLGLHGAVKVETEHIPSMEKIEKIYKNKLELGGRYKPNKCVARHRVAIIVPYR